MSRRREAVHPRLPDLGQANDDGIFELSRVPTRLRYPPSLWV